jgi:hypothetical protein
MKSDFTFLQLLLGLLYLVRELVEGWIPVEGQADPSSIVGDSLLGKNAQKNDTNRTFEPTNSIIPHQSRH